MEQMLYNPYDYGNSWLLDFGGDEEFENVTVELIEAKIEEMIIRGAEDTDNFLILSTEPAEPELHIEACPMSSGKFYVDIAFGIESEGKWYRYEYVAYDADEVKALFKEFYNAKRVRNFEKWELCDECKPRKKWKLLDIFRRKKDEQF